MKESTSPHVLLVGDPHYHLSQFDNYFKTAGWKLKIVNSSSAAIQAVRESQFDVVIADLSVPEFKDFKFMQALQGERPQQAVIVLGGAGTVSEALNALKKGAVDYLQRPLDFASIEQAVLKVIGGQRERKPLDCQVNNLTFFCSTFEFKTSELLEIKHDLEIFSQLQQQGHIDLETKMKLILAFQEALTNSIEHGNLELHSSWKEEFNESGIDKYSLEKKARVADSKYVERLIRITISCDYNSLEIGIEDQGKGFLGTADTSNEPGKNSELSSYGRGMSIIIGIMDEIKYLKEGRVVVMKKFFGQEEI